MSSATLTGLWVPNVVSWPDGDRAFLGTADESPAVTIRAYGVSSSQITFQAAAPAGVLSVEHDGDGQTVRLTAAGSTAPLWTARCSGVFHFDADSDEVWAFQLPAPAQAAVKQAVGAVVSRDTRRVGSLLDDEHASTEDFWMWAVDDDRPVSLSTPPGEFSSWPIDTTAVTVEPGTVHLAIAMWEIGTGPTDLTLQMHVLGVDSETPRVELDDLHVL
jgi:hypothetical protein